MRPESSTRTSSPPISCCDDEPPMMAWSLNWRLNQYLLTLVSLHETEQEDLWVLQPICHPSRRAEKNTSPTSQTSTRSERACSSFSWGAHPIRAPALWQPWLVWLPLRLLGFRAFALICPPCSTTSSISFCRLTRTHVLKGRSNWNRSSPRASPTQPPSPGPPPRLRAASGNAQRALSRPSSRWGSPTALDGGTPSMQSGRWEQRPPPLAKMRWSDILASP